MSDNTKTEPTMSDWVCWMLTMSCMGWQQRPDYFDTNDLLLLGDLAYLAATEPDDLKAGLGTWRPTDAYELCCGLQRCGASDGLWEYLKSKAAVADLWGGPSCDLEKYGKWRDKDTETPPLDLGELLADTGGADDDRR